MSRIPRGRPKLKRVICLLAAVLGVCAALLIVPLPESFIAEDSTSSGPIETAQLWLWIGSGLIALGFATTPLTPIRDRALRIWFGVCSLIAAGREADLHELTNADRLEARGLAHLGVSYRIDWWLDSAVSIWLKLGWGLVFGVVLGLMTLPLVVARVPFVRMGWKGRLPVQLMFVAGVCLVIGYASDDLLGRGQFVSKQASKSVEEVAELLGAVFWMLSIFAWRCVRLRDALK